MAIKETTEPESSSEQTLKINNKALHKRQFRDKIVFTLNFILLIISVAAFFKSPLHFAYVNAISIIVMMVHRMYEFYLYKWQFYLVDICYVVNAVIIIYTIFYPTDYNLFICAFAFSMGPVFTSIFYYRLGFVFHNTIKMTSLWIHYSGPLTMFLIRWFDYNNDFIGAEYLNQVSLNFSFVFNYFYNCSIIYLTWFFIHYFLVFHLCDDYIRKNKCVTLYDYFMKNYEKQLMAYGTKWSGLVYMLYGLVSMYMGLFLSLLLFFNIYLTSALVLYLTSVAVWNGASYYMNYFSVHYMKQFSEGGDGKSYETPV